MTDMMTFLQAVLPAEQTGQRYCSVFIGHNSTDIATKAKVITAFHSSIEDLANTLENPPSGIWNTYFLVASTKSDSRKREAIARHKAFFIDIDVGENKPYASKGDAVTALNTFMQVHELPAPTIVDSGRGLHVYWTLDEAIATFEWLKIAEQLKHACLSSGFAVDAMVIADASRILRAPFTMNVKEPTNPIPCVLATMAPPINLDSFKIAIGYQQQSSFEALESRFADNAIDQTSQNILGAGLHKELVQGLKLSLAGAGCAYLAIAYKYQDKMSEPQWRSALSIAQHCSDAEVGIHQISKKHPEYTRQDTIQKASNISAPHTCETFRGVFSMMHPDIPAPPEGKSYCDKCPRKNELKSPIMLCVTQEMATEDDSNFVTYDADTGAEIEVQVPVHTYPVPYYGLKGGGVFKRVRIEDDPDAVDASLQELQGKRIYEYHIWVDSLQVDPLEGEVVVICLKQPRQGLVRFSLPFNKVTSLNLFTEVLSTHGVSAPSYKDLMDYIKAFVNKLQNESNKIHCPASFGWADDYSSFVLGNRRYLSSGEVEYCLPSSATQDAAQLYGMRNLHDIPGSNDGQKIQFMVEAFKRILELYARPGNEARLFTVFVSMGGPLFAFFDNIDGVILHLTNKESGVGKSTVQHVANAVWGIPNNQTLMSLSDTKLAILQRLGVLRHVPMCIDELTTVEADKLCQFIFDISQGRGRHRMEANTNRMRQNVTSWRIPVITSGNNDLHQLMTKHKRVADGEAMRTMALEISRDTSLSHADGKAITDKLFSHDLMLCYGVVGDMLLRHYVQNVDSLRAELMNIRAKFDKDAALTQRERYYSALCAIAIVAGEVTKSLGLHDVNLKDLYKWVTNMCSKASHTAEEGRIGLTEQFREFLHEMQPNTFVTDRVGPNTTVLRMPSSGRTAEVRLMKNTDTMRINRKTLEAWCTDNGVPFKALLGELVAEYGAKPSLPLELSVGPEAVKVRCLTVTASLILDADELDLTD